MTETARIRWEPIEHGGWTGHVGNIDPPLFNLRRRRVAWVLTAVIPGTSYRIIRDDAAHSIPPVTELQAEAERWLAEFVSSLGAVFPGEPGESAAFQLSEARDVLARWDAEQDGEPVISREKVLADQVRVLLAIADRQTAATAGED